jgi:hypothetical protein
MNKKLKYGLMLFFCVGSVFCMNTEKSLSKDSVAEGKIGRESEEEFIIGADPSERTFGRLSCLLAEKMSSKLKKELPGVALYEDDEDLATPMRVVVNNDFSKNKENILVFLKTIDYEVHVDCFFDVVSMADIRDVWNSLKKIRSFAVWRINPELSRWQKFKALIGLFPLGSGNIGCFSLSFTVDEVTEACLTELNAKLLEGGSLLFFSLTNEGTFVKADARSADYSDPHGCSCDYILGPKWDKSCFVLDQGVELKLQDRLKKIAKIAQLKQAAEFLMDMQRS